MFEPLQFQKHDYFPVFWGAILGNSQETWKISVGESHNKQNGKTVPKIFYDAIYSDEKNFALDSFF